MQNDFDVPSPCRNVCSIDEGSKLCLGCYRTIDEITLWGRMSPDKKLAVVEACLARQHMPNNSGNSANEPIIAAGVPGNASDGCE